MNRLVSLVVVGALFALLCGCGHAGPKLYPVSGTVTLDGQPLADGTVYFKIIDAGLIVSMPVKEGKFAGAATEGKHRVEVVAYRLIPVTGEMGGEVQQSQIAPRFNSASTLTADVAPKAEGNVYEFKVESK
jgi:hypothetical protein